MHRSTREVFPRTGDSGNRASREEAKSCMIERGVRRKRPFASAGVLRFGEKPSHGRIHRCVFRTKRKPPEGGFFSLAKDCYFNKMEVIVKFRNAADFLLLLNSSKEVSFDEIHRAFQFQK